MQLLNSCLFVPGDQQRMIDKALGLDLNAAIFDLEDAVASARRLSTALGCSWSTNDRNSDICAEPWAKHAP